MFEKMNKFYITLRLKMWEGKDSFKMLETNKNMWKELQAKKKKVGKAN